MGVKLGNDYLLWVKVGAGAYTVVSGQGDLSIKRSATAFSTGSKTSSGYDTQDVGLRQGSASLKLMPDLPDAGFTALEGAALANPQEAFSIQVRKGSTAGADPDDVVFECLVKSTDFNADYPKIGRAHV